MSEQKKPRVLVYVKDGKADYAFDEGVDVLIFDQDDYDQDPVGTEKPPEAWAELANLFDIPVEKPVEMKGEWHAAIDEMRQAGFAVVIFNPDEMGDSVDARNLEGCLAERGNYLIERS